VTCGICRGWACLGMDVSCEPTCLAPIGNLDAATVAQALLVGSSDNSALSAGRGWLGRPDRMDRGGTGGGIVSARNAQKLQVSCCAFHGLDWSLDD
jgi:hypothetical protein